MKTCSKCKEIRPLDQFYTQNDRKSGTSYCKSCFNAYTIQRWINKKIEAINYKGGACLHCGYNKFYGALEFHHINPNEKDVDWSKLRLRSLDKIKHELDKCILLCSNCHREEHHRLLSS